ncbi:hypothetical protein TKK_0017269 [Trichogramma kaykai]
MDEAVSTLGLKWIPARDYFTFHLAPRTMPSAVTRRSILSELSRTFDPMGWLAPVLVTAKRAYAAALYAVTPGGSASLLVAKTKLAPIKVQTIPRLELFAATLFTRLARNFLDKLRHPPARIFCWTNSSVVFEWIKGHPSRWPTFVANRVNEIQTTLPDARWRHVRTEDNPADCATRGLTPRELAAFSLWWAGPAWISCGEETWPSMTTQASNAQVVLAMVTGCEKARPAVVDATAVTECLPDLCKYSNFHRIISVIYHFYRWHFRANKRAADGSKLLDADIWRKARWCCFKVIQAHHFKEEIQAIKNKKPIILVRNDRLRVTQRNSAAPLAAGHDFITVEYYLKHQAFTKPPSHRRRLAAVTPKTFGDALRPLLNDPTNRHALTCANDGAAGLDTAVGALTELIVDAADAVAPLRPCALSSSHSPWVDRGIRMLMDRRDRAYRRFRRNQRHEDLLRYRLLRTENTHPPSKY